MLIKGIFKIKPQLSFSYPMDFPNNASLADAIAYLIKEIGAKNVYLLGQSYGGMIAQSYGGMIAQITAKRHPDIIKGMILSGACGLGQGMDEEGFALINKMLDPKKSQEMSKSIKSFQSGF